MTAFLTLFNATKRPVTLWIAIETAPNLPSPKCLIIKKSYSLGGWIYSFLIYLRFKNLAELSQELVGLPNFVEI